MWPSGGNSALKALYVPQKNIAKKVGNEDLAAASGVPLTFRRQLELC